MDSKIPTPEPQYVGYEDLVPLYADLRHIVHNALGDRYHPLVRAALDGFGPDEEFERDSALREEVAEVLLACILWVEAERPCEEILRDCAHEIKSRLLYVSNLFLKFLELRAVLQKGEIASLGSMSTAWIHLFVEFRDELVKPLWRHWLAQSRRHYSLEP